VWNDRLVSTRRRYAYAWYAEKAAAQPNEVIYGFEGGSRSGHGAYIFGQMEYAPSATSPVTVGFRFGTVRASTTGSTVGCSLAVSRQRTTGRRLSGRWRFASRASRTGAMPGGGRVAPGARPSGCPEGSHHVAKTGPA